MTSLGSPTAPAAPTEDASIPESGEDRRAQRRALAAVWLAAGSALAAMIGVGWYVVIRNGSHPPGGDMIGHAAAAEWLRTLPWWDWRGWSDWFFGGQAIGVNYPPLGHALLRFTHPAHGQMAAVAVGLLVLLPWGTIRLTRAVGCTPRVQRVGLGAVLVLVAASGRMHWVLSGFHSSNTFFGSWPAMLATVLGLFCAAWAARCAAPLACGVVAGVAILFNATVVPGVAVVCLALLATGGVSFRSAARWAATAGAAALAVCAWWLVPFVAGWDRLVRWQVPFSDAWETGGVWQAAVLTVLGAATAWVARRGPGPSRRLALVSAAGFLAALVAEFVGYLRPERWLLLPILVAAAACGGALAGRKRQAIAPQVRPAWALLGGAAVIVFVVITVRLEVLPLAAWLLFPRRAWAAAGAGAWACILLWVPLWSQIRDPLPPEPPPRPLEEIKAQGGAGAEGLVYLDRFYNTSEGDREQCGWGFPWVTTVDAGGRIRPLTGLYRETSHSAEFVSAELHVNSGTFGSSTPSRPDWLDAWQRAGSRSLGGREAAGALGARWFAYCDETGDVVLADLARTGATGVTVVPYLGDKDWHRAAVNWWVPIATGDEVDPAEGVPILTAGEPADFPVHRAAGDVSLRTAGDSLIVRAESAGWAWIRVPWDPDWRSLDGTPVRKGGPGHLVVWASEGLTELRWSVSRPVDIASAVVSGVAALVAIVPALLRLRGDRGTDSDREQRRSESVSGPGRILTGREL